MRGSNPKASLHLLVKKDVSIILFVIGDYRIVGGSLAARLAAQVNDVSSVGTHLKLASEGGARFELV